MFRTPWLKSNEGEEGEGCIVEICATRKPSRLVAESDLPFTLISEKWENRFDGSVHINELYFDRVCLGCIISGLYRIMWRGWTSVRCSRMHPAHNYKLFVRAWHFVAFFVSFECPWHVALCMAFIARYHTPFLEDPWQPELQAHRAHVHRETHCEQKEDWAKVEIGGMPFCEWHTHASLCIRVIQKNIDTWQLHSGGKVELLCYSLATIR